jgi:hypothetical protein
MILWIHMINKLQSFWIWHSRINFYSPYHDIFAAGIPDVTTLVIIGRNENNHFPGATWVYWAHMWPIYLLENFRDDLHCILAVRLEGGGRLSSSWTNVIQREVYVSSTAHKIQNDPRPQALRLYMIPLSYTTTDMTLGVLLGDQYRKESALAGVQHKISIMNLNIARWLMIRMQQIKRILIMGYKWC